MRYRPKRENYYNGVYGEIHYQKNLEKYCTYLENKNKQLTLTEVSQRRELLEAYQHFIDWNEEHDRKASTSQRIEAFIASNCG